MYKDQEELQDLHRKLQNAVDGFRVRGSPTLSSPARSGGLLTCMKVSSLLRNELNSLQAAGDGSAVRDLANRILERQDQQDAKREAESRRIIELQMQQNARREAEALQREAEARRILELQELQVKQNAERAGQSTTFCAVRVN
jgi:hypothetical protein